MMPLTTAADVPICRGCTTSAAVLNANATETDKAIAWAVENDLLKAAKNNGETYEATDPVNRTEVIKAWNQVQAFKK